MQIVEIVTAFAYLICSYWIWGDGIGFMRLNRTGGQHAEQIPYRRHHRRNMTIQGRGGRFFFPIRRDAGAAKSAARSSSLRSY
jgi:hypothetical protein